MLATVFVGIWWFTGANLLPLSVLMYVHALDVYIRRTNPPLVLLLASSSEHTRQIYQNLISVSAPYKVASLLLIQARVPFDVNSLISSQRTDDDAEWQEVAQDQMLLSKLIVVDARVDTEPVQDEIGRIVRLGICFKSVFIVQPSIGERPILEGHLPAGGLCITADEALIVARAMRGGVKSWPTPQRPIAEIMADSGLR